MKRRIAATWQRGRNQSEADIGRRVAGSPGALTTRSGHRGH